jgi:predicted nuclease of predicted toxin-antitoxin system
MKIIVDMNLPPAWCEVLEAHGHEANHWSDLGPIDASDRSIMEHAHAHGAIVFTHDLDFGAILAATGTDSPSVIQLRTQDPTPQTTIDVLLQVLDEFESELHAGALLSVDRTRTRVRVLPLRSRGRPSM